MTFVHDDAGAFEELVQIVAGARGISPSLVEKDYWVTHTLWALHQGGLDVRFKGGTSLSKGFGLIERFSEDLDLRIEPGTVTELAPVTNWKGEGAKATTARRAYFEKLATLIEVPGATTKLDVDSVDQKRWLGVEVRVGYPGQHLSGLGVMAPFVRLELGVARVTPATQRDMSSFVHDHLATIGQLASYADNRPRAVFCVRPLVTLIEKLDALHRRHAKGKEPASYVRHFEDAARIVAAIDELEPLEGYEGAAALALEMLAEKQIVQVPLASDAAFKAGDTAQWASVRQAHAEIAPMFWGPRISIDVACESIREWISKTLA